jgi:hypothetical protein
MNNFEIIDSVLSKYKLDHALPDSVRREIIRSKKDILINILKSAGKYTFFTAVIINILLFAKKLGFGVSAVKLNIAIKTIIVVTTSTAAITTGTAVYNHSIKKITADVLVSNSKETEKAASADIRILEEIPSYAFEIMPFTCPAELSQESKDLSKDIYDTIIRNYGRKSAVIFEKDKTYRSKYILSGTFSKLGENYYVSVKLVNAADSRIISITNKTASNTDDMKKIPEEIINELPRLKLK